MDAPPSGYSARVALAALAALALAAAPAAASGHAYDYTFAWTERGAHEAERAGSTATGDSTTVAFDLKRPNLTVVRFLVTWTPQHSSGDVVELTVTGPNGSTYGPRHAAASVGAVEVRLRLAEVPPGTVTVRAADDAAAWGDFLERYPPTVTGTGRWMATLEVRPADDGGVLPVGKPAASSTRVDWELAFDVADHAGVLKDKRAVADGEPLSPSPTEMPSGRGPPAPGDASPAAESLFATPGFRSGLVLLTTAAGAGVGMLYGLRKTGA